MSEDLDLAEDIKQLAERVSLLEDIRKLNTLRHNLPRHINNGDWARVGDLFSVDATVDYAHLGQVDGREDIRKYFAGLPDAIGQDKPGSRLSVKQFVHGHEVTVHGDEATGVSFFEERVVFDDESFMVAGKFDDRYVRESGRWLFASITLDLYWVLPHGEGLTRKENA
jgi:hypothetical protein